jgi:hypothetical protein
MAEIRRISSEELVRSFPPEKHFHMLPRFFREKERRKHGRISQGLIEVAGQQTESARERDGVGAGDVVDRTETTNEL